MERYRDKQLKQLEELQVAEEELKKIDYLLLHYKYSPSEKKLVEMLRKATQEKIDEIRRQNMKSKGDCLSCKMMNY